jgi:hypothetical protein
MFISARPRVGLPAVVATLAFLAGCATTGSGGKPEVSLTPGPSQSQEGSLPATASLPAGDTTLTPGCFLTPAEVEAATGKTLTKPPEASTGPKGDQSCQYYLEGTVPPGGFGCTCLSTNGPFDLQGQGTGWLDNLPPGGETVDGVGDEAYMFNASTGNDFWAVKGQTGIHISISFQFLTAEQFTTLANAGFGHIEAGAG